MRLVFDRKTRRADVIGVHRPASEPRQQEFVVQSSRFATTRKQFPALPPPPLQVRFALAHLLAHIEALEAAVRTGARFVNPSQARRLQQALDRAWVILATAQQDIL